MIPFVHILPSFLPQLSMTALHIPSQIHVFFIKKKITQGVQLMLPIWHGQPTTDWTPDENWLSIPTGLQLTLVPQLVPPEFLPVYAGILVGLSYAGPVKATTVLFMNVTALTDLENTCWWQSSLTSGSRTLSTPSCVISPKHVVLSTHSHSLNLNQFWSAVNHCLLQEEASLKRAVSYTNL